MLWLVECECGETMMTLGGNCKKCGKDRALGGGRRLVKKFLDDMGRLREDQRCEARALISSWVLGKEVK